jgi:hypothetical protein
MRKGKNGQGGTRTHDVSDVPATLNLHRTLDYELMPLPLDHLPMKAN